MGGSSSSLFFLLIMAALLVFMFSRTRKQQKAQQQMQNSVGPGAEVMTTSGMFGTVVERTDEYVVIEVAPGLQTRWTPRAVARVVTPAAPVETTPSPGETGRAADADGLDLTKRPETPGDDTTGGATRSQ
ncbi:preprotein translocase subunit YajC [Kineococcus sp. SYSU DK003]|uniref:preprotein translocase subunit YajC n=1 Tax=Kineococcus sp. SYSU DK003 TaxID=3383124 RepID=UPI003D7EFDD0